MDGGYLNAIPTDVMRETMGADVVIVVDVEDDDYLAFRDLTPRDGGLGGWRLLWERVDPLAGARATARDAMRGARVTRSKNVSFRVFHPRRGARSISRPTPRRVRVGSHRERRGTSRDVANVRLVRQPFKRAAPRDVVAPVRASLARARHRPVPAPARGQRLDRAAHAAPRRRARPEAHAHSCVAVEAWRARAGARAAERAAAADGAGAPAGGRQVDAARPDDKSAETRHGSAIGAPRAPSPARRSLELAVDRTGHADRDRRDPLLGAKNAEETDCPYVEGIEGVEGPATPVANAASSIVTRSPRAVSPEPSLGDAPPPSAPGADEAVTRLRADCPYDASSSSAGSFGSGDATGFHSAAELFEGACASSVKETKEGVEKGVESPGDGAPRKGSETRKGTSDARAEKTAKAADRNRGERSTRSSRPPCCTAAREGDTSGDTPRTSTRSRWRARCACRRRRAETRGSTTRTRRTRRRRTSGRSRFRRAPARAARRRRTAGGARSGALIPKTRRRTRGTGRSAAGRSARETWWRRSAKKTLRRRWPAEASRRENSLFAAKDAAGFWTEACRGRAGAGGAGGSVVVTPHGHPCASPSARVAAPGVPRGPARSAGESGFRFFHVLGETNRGTAQ